MTRFEIWTLAAVLVVACTNGEEEEVTSGTGRIDQRGRVVLTTKEATALGLQTASVENGGLTTTVLRYGRVSGRPQEDALVTAPLTGRLDAPAIALGARVSVGDLLVALEPLVDTASRATIDAQRRELDGQVESARAQVEAKSADFRRMTTLVSAGLATDSDQAQAEANLISEQARVASLKRASHDLAQMTRGRIELRAPVAGIVATLATEAGAIVPQGTVLARIVRPGPRWIDMAVPPDDPIGSAYLVRIRAGTVPAELQFRGAVIQADGTRRDRIEVEFEAGAELLPGSVVPVEVARGTPGLVVPAGALLRNGHDTVIFVETDANAYEMRSARVAAQDDTRAVLESGVVSGNRVVVRGASALLGEIGSMRAGAIE